MSEGWSDQQLVEQFFSGCEESFKCIVERYESKIFSTALYLTDDTQDAEEVLFGVFHALHHQLFDDFGKTPLFDWLIQYTLDLSVQRLIEKKQEAVRLPVHGSQGASGITDHIKRFEESNTSLRTALCKAVVSLPEQLKFVFLLRDIQGLPLTKTANILGLTVFEARARLHQARLLIREELTPVVATGKEQAS